MRIRSSKLRAVWALTTLLILGSPASAEENCVSKCHRELVACAEANCVAYDDETGECVQPQGGSDSPCYAAYDACPARCEAERKKKTD